MSEDESHEESTPPEKQKPPPPPPPQVTPTKSTIKEMGDSDNKNIITETKEEKKQ